MSKNKKNNIKKKKTPHNNNNNNNKIMMQYRPEKDPVNPGDVSAGGYDKAVKSREALQRASEASPSKILTPPPWNSSISPGQLNELRPNGLKLCPW